MSRLHGIELTLPKLKAIEKQVNLNDGIYLQWYNNTLRKGENAGYQHILFFTYFLFKNALYPHCFSAKKLPLIKVKKDSKSPYKVMYDRTFIQLYKAVNLFCIIYTCFRYKVTQYHVISNEHTCTCYN